MNEKKPPVAQYVVLGLLFFAACAYQVRATIASFPGFLDRGAAAWPFVPGYVRGEPKAVFIRPEGRQAGVHDGDVLTAVNGRAFTGLAVFGEAIAAAKPGDALRIMSQTPGSQDSKTATIFLRPASDVKGLALGAVLTLKVVLPFFSILLGFWVAFVRPRDMSVWLLIGVLLGLGNLFTAYSESWGPGIRDLAELYRFSCNQAWPLCMLFFGLYFPQPFPPDRAQTLVRLAKYVLAPLLIIDGLVSIVIRIGEVENYAKVAALAAFWRHLGSCRSGWVLLRSAAFLPASLSSPALLFRRIRNGDCAFCMPAQSYR